MDNQKTKHHDSIIEYYEETDVSYQSWGGEGAYQIHYGYKDSPDLNHYETLYRMNEILSEAVNISKDDYMLDAGCGVGGSCSWVAKNRGAKAHGITLPEIQVKKAKEFASKTSLPLEFSRQDYTNTNFPDNNFNVVWALESVCHTASKFEFLKEAHRVLKPAGRIVVADYFLYKPEEKLNEIEAYSLRKWLDGWTLANLATRDGFQKSMEQIGYKNIQIKNITRYVLSSVEEIYVRGKEGYPDDILNKDRNVKQMKHVEANMFQKVALDLGTWSYCIFTAEK